MPAQVHVIAGASLVGKTTRLLQRYRQELAGGVPGAALWLAPSQRSVADLREKLLGRELEACFSPGIMTFAGFAAAVVDASPAVIRPLSQVMKRHLVHRLIDAAMAEGRLRHFAPIAGATGLVDLVDAWISELKRLEIWPEDFRRACQARGMSDKDRELLALYESYQHALTTHRLFDSEGRFWSARALLRDGQTRPFEPLRLVVADGFTDFTRTQHEILQILAERVDELWISLPLEPEPRRDDLFAKSLATLQQLLQAHPQLQLIEMPAPSEVHWPAMQHLERELFKSPRKMRPAVDTRGIEVLAAAKSTGEMESIGKRIKELLTVGREESNGRPVPPGEIAVVFRSLVDAAPLVRQVFSELGIPFALEAGRSLNDSPALASLVALLNLQRDDWPFRHLLAVLGNNYFQPEWPEWRGRHTPALVELAIRELQIPDGRVELLRRVRRAAEPPTAAEENGAAASEARDQRAERRQQQAQAALPVLLRLEEAFLKLPREATPRQWAGAIEQLADETGFLRAIDQREADPPASATQPPTRDRVSWERLRDALLAADDLAGWLDGAALGEPPNGLLGLAEIIELVLDNLRCEQLPGDHDEVGRVRVLSAYSARTLAVPYLFFAGLSERAMPAPDREDRLYSDAENSELRERGLPLVLRAHRTQDEMLLFYEVATRARRYLLFSYPALDEKAQPLLASPYLQEAERALGEGQVRRWTEPDLSPIPRNTLPLCPTDLRLLAVSQALAGQPRLLGSLMQKPCDPEMVDNLLAGLGITEERAKTAGFGPHEGMFNGHLAQEQLANRFDSEHCWSASDLESYASCPHQFFLNKILRLTPLPEISLETNFMERGWVMHAALAQLHRHLGVSPASLPEEEFEKAFTEVLGLLMSLGEKDATLAGALREVDRRILSDWLRNYYQQHEAYDKAQTKAGRSMQPAYFEVSFGMKLEATSAATDSISTETPLVLVQGADSIRLQGRIDRIDMGELAEQPVFNVVDYKSGRPKPNKKDLEFDGTTLQLDLYSLAAERLLLAKEFAMPLANGYWYVREAGFKLSLTMHEEQLGQLEPTPAWTERQQQLVETLLALARGVRTGQFVVSSRDEHCTSYCPFKTVCRINQVRSLEKVWSPPAAG